MTRKIELLLACVMITLLFAGLTHASDGGAVVNMMIDAGLFPYANEPDILENLNKNPDAKAANFAALTPENKIDIEFDSLIIDILNEIDPENLNVTIFLTEEYVSAKIGNYSYLLLTSYISNRDNHEMAINGKTSNEKLANMNYQVQKSHIADSKILVERAHICGGNAAKVIGFRPQSFSQNNDTYEILDQFNFSYDAGFQAGNLYLPGHEKDTWPYPVKNHTIYAVPVSTIKSSSGELMPMSDRVAFENGLNGSQWLKMLIDKYSESEKNGSPMVVIFTNFIIGSNKDYLDAYREFVEYASNKSAKFVTTQQLVEMSKSRSSK